MQVSDHADLVETIRDHAPKDVWEDISFDRQRYIALPELMRQARDNIQGGEKLTWPVKVEKTDTAQPVGLFTKRTVDVPMLMTTAEVPWRHVTAYWVSNELEDSLAKGPERLVKIVNVRRNGAFQDLCAQFESGFWSTGGAGDDYYGLFYYLVHNNTVGQTGGNPTVGGSTVSVAGISRDDYANWKNWSGSYTDITRTDFVRKMRELANKSKFLNPYPNPTPSDKGRRMGYYTDYAVWEILVELAQNQNDRLGPDLTALEGRVTFHGQQIVWVPELDSHGYDPMIGINWSVVKFKFLTGEFMNELGAKQSAEQPRTWVHWIDTTLNLECTNPRNAGFEMSTEV